MENHYPPGPKASVWQALRTGASPLASDRLGFLKQMFEQYGDSVRYEFGKVNVFMFFHPDTVREILVDHPEDFHKSMITHRVLDRVMGEGLLLTEGDVWKRQRRMVQPAFHARRIENYAEVMVEYADDMASAWASGPAERDIADEMMSLTLRIVARTLFDADVSGMEGQTGEAMDRLQSLVTNVARRAIPIPDWLPTPVNVKGRRATAMLDRIIWRFVEERRAASDDRGDLLSMLLLARDEEGGGAMTDRELRDEIMTLFLAGHETTSLALTWTWYLLSQNPEVEAKLHDELDRVLGGRLPTMADLARLTYTDQVIKESMRLFPPVYLTARTTAVDTTAGGYDLPTRSGVIISPYITHRDPRWWPEPEAFRPERFEPGWEEALPKYAYYPFGGGPRVCIGNSFAMMEARLLLATLARRFSLRLAPGQIVDTEPLVTLRPRYGMRMQIDGREPVVAAAPRVEEAVAAAPRVEEAVAAR